MLMLLYNIIQISMLLLLWPLILVVVCLTPKYRGRFGRRLGLGLDKIKVPLDRKRIWVHALSVGEAASARPLIESLKANYPDIFIIFSTTTTGGEKIAATMGNQVDLLIAFPVDLIFVVNKFLRVLQPDLFVLVETDFWPNIIGRLTKKGVPCVLANGRITEKSYRRYFRFRWFFRLFFASFSHLSMQTGFDAENILRLGADPEKVKALGNLKYDIGSSLKICETQGMAKASFRIPDEPQVIVAGSTHPGEEKILLEAFGRLLAEGFDLFMVIAPRDSTRGGQILDICQKAKVKAFCRTEAPDEGAAVLILNTIGELAKVYAFADLAFVGGSMVKCGGHNPLEPAVYGKAVLFGKDMADFAEIAGALQAVGAAESIRDGDHLFKVMRRLLAEPGAAAEMGRRGAALVHEHQGAVGRYLNLFAELLGDEKKS